MAWNEITIPIVADVLDMAALQLDGSMLMTLAGAMLRATEQRPDDADAGGGGGAGTVEAAAAASKAVRGSLKFAKLALAVAQKYAVAIKKLPLDGDEGGISNGVHGHQTSRDELLDMLQAATERCTTFLKKPALAALHRLRK